jgi:hypothetical protein
MALQDETFFAQTGFSHAAQADAPSVDTKVPMSHAMQLSPRKSSSGWCVPGPHCEQPLPARREPALHPGGGIGGSGLGGGGEGGGMIGGGDGSGDGGGGGLGGSGGVFGGSGGGFGGDGELGGGAGGCGGDGGGDGGHGCSGGCGGGPGTRASVNCPFTAHRKGTNIARRRGSAVSFLSVVVELTAAERCSER